MKPAALYAIGTGFIAIGVMFILQSGRKEGLAEASQQAWDEAIPFFPADSVKVRKHADDPGMGTVADADIKHHGHHSPDPAA